MKAKLLSAKKLTVPDVENVFPKSYSLGTKTHCYRGHEKIKLKSGAYQCLECKLRREEARKAGAQLLKVSWEKRFKRLIDPTYYDLHVQVGSSLKIT
ncbi:MAG: hypothetical protein ACREHG_00905 [Candidatus Saccharimonadales bacterium]